MKLKYDLHIHSCLSPCGSDDMTPANIAGMAMLAGLDVFAVSDHGSTKNCRAAAEAAEEYGLVFVPAMELTTDEESHILCLFPELKAAEEFGDYVHSKLADVQNRPEFFGNQFIMDANDNILGTEDRLLISATSISVEQVPALVEEYGGVAIPAHIDRDSFSVLANLGFFDRRWGFPAVEITRRGDKAALAEMHSDLRGMAFITDSDAHQLDALPDAEFELEADERTAKAVIEAVKRGSLTGRLEI